MASADRTCGMDPAYGDDLWSGGFSSEEDEAAEAGNQLDLLASLMAERGEGEGGGGGGEGGEGKEGEKESFQEALNKADDVVSMKAKMEEMEKELNKLKEQVASSGSSTHSNKPRPQKQAPPGNQKHTSPPPRAAKSESRKVANVRGTPSDGAGCGGRSVAERLVVQRKSDREENIATDAFSGLRIKNPLVSSELMRKRMEGRKMIKLPNISSRVRGSDVEGDWVTVGVLVDKLPPKDTVKGDKYAMWKLSDLSAQSAIVLLFLFGKAYQEHWKMAQGSVVALLNPTIMPNRESGTVDTSSRQLALSLDTPHKLMPLGISQDFTVCRATTRAGRKCSNFAKASDGGFCDYHIQGAYNKMRTTRMNCQGGYGPSTANIHGKLFKDSKTDVFYYGGKSYTPGRGSGGGRAGEGGEGGEGGQEKRLFAKGAMECVAEVTQEVAGRREKGGVAVRAGRTVTTSEGGSTFQQMLASQRPGARLLNSHLHKEEERKQQAAAKPAEKSASELLRDESSRTREGVTGTQSPVPLSSFQPRLGRGLVPGSMVDFASGGRVSGDQLRSQQRASSRKLKAAAVLKLAESSTSDIVRRVQGNREGDDDGTHSHLSPGATLPATPSSNGRAGEGEEGEGPLRKRRKLDSAEIEKILNAKSSHDWAAKEVEWEREEQYFVLREKKENMEEKLSTIRQLNVYVSECKQCDYVAESASDLCVRESHALSRYKAVKRWFECQECKERVCTYNSRYPTFPCRRCSSKSFKQTSLFRERKGPKVGAENLMLRGKEEKYLH